MLRVLPLQGEQLLVLFAAQLLQDRGSPAARELPLEIGQRGRRLRVEEESQRDDLAARFGVFPSHLHACDAIGTRRYRALGVAGRRGEGVRAVFQIR